MIVIIKKMGIKSLLILLALMYVGPGEEIKILNPSVNVGNVKLNEKVTYKLLLKNTTSRPVSIINIVGDCGCLGFTWTKKPIGPNTVDTISGTIIVRDSSDFKKSILIYTNSKTGFYTADIVGRGFRK